MVPVGQGSRGRREGSGRSYGESRVAPKVFPHLGHAWTAAWLLGLVRGTVFTLHVGHIIRLASAAVLGDPFLSVLVPVITLGMLVSCRRRRRWWHSTEVDAEEPLHHQVPTVWALLEFCPVAEQALDVLGGDAFLRPDLLEDEVHRLHRHASRDGELLVEQLL